MALDINSLSNNLAAKTRNTSNGNTNTKAAATSASEETRVDVVNSAADRVQLSSQAQNLYGNEQTSFDEARVAELKSQIEAGTYQVNHQKLAANIFNFETKL